jgi:archaellum biogenesis ATPase FlaH
VLERTILANLLYNEEYLRKVLPYLKLEYFHNQNEALTFKLISSYLVKYNTIPSKSTLLVDLSQLQSGINENIFKDTSETIKSLNEDKQDLAWLLDNTEKFCQDKAIYNGIHKSIEILDDKSGKLAKGSIPTILSDALAVSFDTHIGHDYLEDWEQRYNFYHNTEEHIQFDIDILNKITDGGVTKKTLTILLGGVGFGKTLMQCHFAAANLVKGKNVLYITMEMSEEKISERIDANLLNIPLKDLKLLPKDLFEKKIAKIREKTIGKLVVKEYPPTSAGADNFRHLLNELRLKKKFTPDIVYIDYLNLCKSSRVKFSGDLYTYIKTVAEEIRGLAVENNIPIISATQLNREGFTSSDPGMEHTSESFGLPATCDTMWVIVTTEELEALNQVLFKQIKNRYNDANSPRRFIIGCDRSKMRLYNVEGQAQKDLTQANLRAPVSPSETKASFNQSTPFNDDKPVFDRARRFEEWK